MTTAFPPGTGLEVSSVAVRGGLATVRLDSSALQADDDAREQMSAQIVWTLKQLPEVQHVRITAGGDSPLLPGVSEDVNHDPWPTYDPDDLPATPSAYVVYDGRVGRYLDGSLRAGAGAGGTGPTDLRSPGGVPGRHPAGGGRAPTVAPCTSVRWPGAAARVPDQRHRLSASPSWDRGKNLWVVDRATGRSGTSPTGPTSRGEVTVRRRWAPSASRSPCPSRGTGPGSRWSSAPDGRRGCGCSPYAGRRPPTPT